MLWDGYDVVFNIYFCRALWLMVPGIVLIVTLAVLVGIVMYAFYADCDPLKFKLVGRADQVCHFVH